MIKAYGEQMKQCPKCLGYGISDTPEYAYAIPGKTMECMLWRCLNCGFKDVTDIKKEKPMP